MLWCIATTNQPDTPLFFNPSNTTFSFNSYSEQWIYVHALGKDVEVRGHNDTLHVASLQGPKSREILQGLSDFDVVSLPRFGVGRGLIGNVPAWVTRTGYTAELGYDIYVEVELGAELFSALFDSVRAQGGGLCGSAALNLRRMDAAILNFTEDFDWQHTPFDIGLGWMVDFDKPNDFTGRSALEQWVGQPPTQKLVGLFLDEAVPLQAGTELLAEGRSIGETTSAVRSPTLGRKIALGWVETAYAKPGQKIQAGFETSTAEAEVVKRPFFDPERKLMKA